MPVTLPLLAARLDLFTGRVHELSASVAGLAAARADRGLTLAWLREVHPFKTVTLLNLAHALYADSTALLGADAGPADEAPGEAQPLTDHEREFLARLCRTIDAHLARRGLTVCVLAKLMGRSPRQLQRDVVRLTGLSPRDLLRVRRMVRARALLRSRQLRTIAEVAARVGMTSSHLSRTYTAWAGYPPSNESSAPDPALPASDTRMPGSDIARGGR